MSEETKSNEEVKREDVNSNTIESVYQSLKRTDEMIHRIQGNQIFGPLNLLKEAAAKFDTDRTRSAIALDSSLVLANAINRNPAQFNEFLREQANAVLTSDIKTDLFNRFRIAAEQEQQQVQQQVQQQTQQQVQQQVQQQPGRVSGEVASDCSDVRPIVLKADFNDIVGMELEKATVETRIVGNILFPASIPKVSGILMYGPPGNGKTIFASAMARRIQQMLTQAFPSTVPGRDHELIYAVMFVLSAADLKGSLYGQTEAKMQHAFECAESQAVALKRLIERDSSGDTKAILFFDEIDAIAASRSKATQTEQTTVNMLLQLMDGAKKFEHVIMVGATNLPFSIDAAVMSRFKIHIFVDLPDRRARMKYFETKLREAFGLVVKDEQKQIPEWSGIIASLVNATGPSRAAFRLIEEKVFKVIQKVGAPLQSYDEYVTHRINPSSDTEPARHMFGMSFRDLDKLMDTIIGTAGVQFLKKNGPNGENDSCVYMADKFSKKPACGPERVGDRSRIRPTTLTEMDITRALSSTITSIEGNEYMNLLYYYMSKGSTRPIS